MALFTPSQSPAITIKEVDLTGVVPNVQTSTGAFVGDFSWGPIRNATLVANEAGLVEAFGSPTTTNNIDYFAAANFLRYSNSLYVVREATTAALNASDSSGVALQVRDKDHFDSLTVGDSNQHYIARYAGTLGNSLKIASLSAADSDSVFSSWTYASSFDAAPGTSTFATGVSASNDEIHVAVIDEDGDISGTAGTVLETFPFLSVALNAKADDGTSNYIKDVINTRSEYIYFAGFDSDATVGNAGTNASSGVDFRVAQSRTAAQLKTAATKSTSLSGGANSGTLTTSEVATGFDLFEDVDNITVDMLIAPGMAARADQTTVVNDLVSIAGSTRKDCVVVTSPARNDIVNIAASTAVTNAVTTADTFTNSSYLIVDNQYLKVYDKYNDKFIFVPAASSVAGLMAASDLNAGTWFSPAGSRRGNLLGVTALAYSPNKSQRDTLYKAGVNPIANIPGQGVMLFGDKTHLAKPSAFDRINVRRLFLAIERAVSQAARNVMFEFNDEFTRAEFVNVIEPFLREIQGRRGITDFRVVCDATNNTAAVIDRNEFIASLFIKPARSINYITLNFVAVRTGVDFEEIAGTV
jgi:phage tail sheath protein FI